ncbi:MAG: universal stress protein [Gammaproteobacteria bacterium]|nr:universal stress protein [Gammaproteobacteria bacterium]MBI5614777.1 universal stress protein [Gammaproteobacteria bacterium]
MYQTILLAYDGSADGRAALEQGSELAALCRSKVHLVAVLTPSAGVELAEAAYPSGMCRQWQQDDVDRVLDEGAVRLREAGLDVTTHFCRGQPAEEIGVIARDVGADLIVVGHREQSAFARWWRGSVGQSLLEHAPCSVLVTIPTRE